MTTKPKRRVQPRRRMFTGSPTDQDKIQFDRSVPPEMRPRIEGYLRGLAWLIPDWCHILYVMWAEEGTGEGTTITCRTDYRYRRAVLTFFPAFFSESATAEEQVIHDMLHAFAGILVEYAEHSLKSLVPESEAPKFREHLLEELSIRHESFVQDLAHRIYLFIKNNRELLK